MRLIRYIVLIGILPLIFSCKKDKAPEDVVNSHRENGVLVLNEGLFNLNNSSLSWLDLKTGEVSQDQFLKINHRLLGDVANDMLCYGNKIYIAVTTSSTIEIIDKYSLKSLQQLSFDYQNQAQQPRHITSHGNKVYVTSYDGYVSAIDTTSLNLTKRIKVGRNPEGICVSNDALYVANSGGLDSPNYDHTVFKIDLDTWNVTDTFDVGNNPGRIVADDFNNLYVVKQGDYNNDASELVKIDLGNHTVSNLGIPATSITLRGDIMYISYYDFNSGNASVATFDCNTQTLLNPNFINAQEITTLYGVLPFKEDEVICLDAMNFTNTGYLKFYNANGQATKSYQVGLNPNTIIYYE